MLSHVVRDKNNRGFFFFFLERGSSLSEILEEIKFPCGISFCANDNVAIK